MFDEAYAVALITRGAGSYAYTYAGHAGLERGQLCVVSFCNGLEVGTVVGRGSRTSTLDRLIPLVPVEAAELGIDGSRAWGLLLCDLAELSASAPRDVAGHLLFAPPARGLRLRIAIHEPSAIPPELRGELAALAGSLTPKKRNALMALGAWGEIAALCASNALSFEIGIVGLPDQTRAHAKLRKSYLIDRSTASLLRLGGQEAVLPGSFLAGIQQELDFPWPVAEDLGHDQALAVAGHEAGQRSSLQWQQLRWSADWSLCQRWPALRQVPLRRAHVTWPTLSSQNGLVAELSADVLAGVNTVVVAPMQWMLTSIWSQFAPWASRIHRFRGDAGPSAAALVLAQLTSGGQVVLGLESSWKLLVYGSFQRVILLDPSHPRFEPEGEPGLDPRLALLLAVTRMKARLDLVEMGLSPWDGTVGLARLSIRCPRARVAADVTPGRGVDLDPLPLELRQPGRKRLVCFNRLGRSRALRCAECGVAARCSRCNSHRVFYSGERDLYICPDCAWQHRDLRCRNCGTASLAVELPGVEALSRRAGDVLVAGAHGLSSVRPDTESVMGTMQLLEPPTGFWPHEIVYVHADSRPGAIDDWSRAVDTAARLAAIYDNPQLKDVYLISGRLSSKLGSLVTASDVQGEYAGEQRLRRLAELPPYGRFLRFSIRGRDASKVASAGREIAEMLQPESAEAVVWLGRVHAGSGGFIQSGYVVNLARSCEELQQLRSDMRKRRISLLLTLLWGPWL